MNDKRCFECGRRVVDHGPRGECRRGVTVDITAATVERARVTGHPRLLNDVLKGKPRNVLTTVEIKSISGV